MLLTDTFETVSGRSLSLQIGIIASFVEYSVEDEVLDRGDNGFPMAEKIPTTRDTISALMPAWFTAYIVRCRKKVYDCYEASVKEEAHIFMLCGPIVLLLWDTYDIQSKTILILNARHRDACVTRNE